MAINTIKQRINILFLNFMFMFFKFKNVIPLFSLLKPDYFLILISVPEYLIVSALDAGSIPVPFFVLTHTILKVRSFNMPGNSPFLSLIVNVLLASFHFMVIVA